MARWQWPGRQLNLAQSMGTLDNVHAHAPESQAAQVCQWATLRFPPDTLLT